jgi:hypothetical protein
MGHVSVTVDFSVKENQKLLSKNEKDTWKELIKLSKTDLEERILADGVESNAFEAPEGHPPKALEKAERLYLANVIMNAQRAKIAAEMNEMEDNEEEV